MHRFVVGKCYGVYKSPIATHPDYIAFIDKIVGQHVEFSILNSFSKQLISRESFIRSVMDVGVDGYEAFDFEILSTYTVRSVDCVERKR